jgi:aminopeptidase N
MKFPVSQKAKSASLVLSGLFIWAACSSTSLNLADLSTDAAPLKRTEAEYRKSLVKDPEYNLTFQFDNASNSYSGGAEIKFQWLGNSSDTLWLDFNQGTVSEFKINEKPVDYQQKKHRLVFSGAALSPGLNRLTLQFKQKFSDEGTGIYRFNDPEDKSVYVYTTLEPYDANKVFPCFDQPDLKASFSMAITAPANWSVVGYDIETSSEKSGENRIWIFPRSLPMSTYVWSIHAGPFKVWSDKQARIPSRLFARKSLARYVQPEDWFTITRQGLDFYEKYFDEPYAFKKYDQIIVPDFKAGAMENVAAVTFNERTVSRGRELHSKKRDRADVILHEMAHMWFGDLVTMKWWNDLWLNESFATYMAALATSKATEFSGEEAWREFFNTKTWAYTTDLQVTTHPIEASISSTDDAFVNFDGITYGKGASLMKQLDFYLGEGGFQKGLQIYFNRHRFSNSSLQDFILALEEGSGKNLSRWTKEWLRSKGLNTVSFRPVCQGDRLFKIHFEQGIANGDATFRSQKTRLALFRSSDAGLLMDSTLDVEYQGRSGDYALNEERKCPKFIYPNLEDQAYFLPNPNASELGLIVDNYSRMESPFLRQTLIFDLWQSVRRGETRLSEFSEILYRALGTESDPANVESLLIYLKNRWGGASIYEYTDFDSGHELESFEDLIWELYRKSSKNSELQMIYQKFYIGFAQSPNHQNNLKQLLNSNSTKRMGVPIDQDDRWSILLSLASAGDPDAKDLLDKELKRDPSHFGLQAHLAGLARIPDRKQKREFFEQIVNSNPPRTSEQVEYITRNLFPARQRELAAEFQEEFYQQLKKVRSSFEPERLGAYLMLLPEECFYGKPGKIAEFLKTNSGLTPQVEKALRITQQDEEICRMVREKDKQKPATRKM